jgi:hypothetical protein
MGFRRRVGRFLLQDVDCMGEYHRMLVALGENSMPRKLCIEGVTTSGFQN